MQNVEIQYTPITLDISLPLKHERERFGRWRLLLMHLQKALGFYRNFTYVNQINEQLIPREGFPWNEWKKHFENVDAIEKILKEVSLDSCKINHHFIPSDLLLYVIWDDVEGHVADWMSSEVRKNMGGECPIGSIMSMATKRYTLKDFFVEVVA